jgi:hypothetical protein
MGILLAIPIAAIYSMVVLTIGEMFNENNSYNEKIRNNLIFGIIGGIIGLVIGIYLFNKDQSYENNIIKYGFYGGAALLLFYAIIYNWSVLGNDSKCVIMIICLGIIMKYAFYINNKKIKSDKKDTKKTNIKTVKTKDNDSDKIKELFND